AQAKIEVKVYQRGLDLIRAAGRNQPAGQLGGVPLTRPALRRQLERTLRDWAGLEQDPKRRVELIDQANQTRRWTLT
ncbi:MAG: hypothetical protein LBJ44_07680, partial [Propionibacteriaceae bacterium]|nr:hypothetical protein [Propionibacteriaceae bacterium]